MKGKVLILACAVLLLATVSVQAQVLSMSDPRAYIAETNQAEIKLPFGNTYAKGSQFVSDFWLYESIDQAFSAYAAVQLPDGTLFDVNTLSTELLPVAILPSLGAPFGGPLLSIQVPAGAPSGNYLMLGCFFFNPAVAIDDPEQSFMMVQTPFTIE